MSFDPVSYALGKAAGTGGGGGGGGGTIVPKSLTANGTYNASADNADGYSPVTVNVSSGVTIESWDFTSATPLVGEIKEFPLVQSNVTFDSQGATFTETNNAIYVIPSYPITIEIDVASMNLTAGTNRRFAVVGSENGIVYRSTGYWGFYAGSWEMFSESDGSLFDGATVKIIVDNSNHWHVYKNGSLLWETTLALPLISGNRNSGSTGFVIGSSSNAINNVTISGMRLIL